MNDSPPTPRVSHPLTSTAIPPSRVAENYSRDAKGSSERDNPMRKFIRAGLIGWLVIVSKAVGNPHSKQEPTADSARSRRILYWVDPMHPEYKSDRPGTAPDCGMPLQAVYADSASLPGATVPLASG